MDPIVQAFIDLNRPKGNNDSSIFWTLVSNRNSDGSAELDFVLGHPEVLVGKINNHLVFDYFYEKVINDRFHPKQAAKWMTVMTEVVKLVNDVSNPSIIKGNKLYVLRLQSTCKTMTKLFSLLIEEDFDMGDPEFLVYSIIARGELSKLEVLSAHYVIEDYPGVMDVALRFGRHQVIQYFVDTLKQNIRYYGKIVDFENYKDSPRYLYYREHIVNDNSFRHKPIVGASKQDYPKAVRLVLEQYDYPITCKTIEIWCEFIRGKEYVWDCVNASETLPLLLDKVSKCIPLTKDFGEFNIVVFGKEWSDRVCLIEHCMGLERRLEEVTARYEVTLSKLRHLQRQL